MRRILEIAFVVALCTVALLVTWDHQRGDSAIVDEPLHLFAGAEYVLDGTIRTNPEHPPLTKDLAGLAIVGMHPRPPHYSDVASFLRFFDENPAFALIDAGRRPFPWLFALLIAIVYLIARRAFGTGAAMLAASVIALDPNLNAHAALIHTDVAAALMMTATIGATLLALHDRRWWPLAGLALGLALLTKFTALILVPFVLLAPLARRDVRTLTRFALAILIALAILLGGYAINLRNTSRDDAARTVASFLAERGASRTTVARFAALTHLLPPAGMFAGGVAGVQLQSANGRGWNYLRGEVSRDGFPSYFLVAFLIKSTPAMLLLAVAIPIGGRRLRDPWAIGLLVPVALLFAVSIGSAFNIGVRHILPIYPLLAIVGAGMLAARLPKRWFAGVAAVIVIGASISLWRSHPHELGYFNIASGEEWLSDSNVDWGQDLERLQSFLQQRGWTRDTTVVVFGSAIADKYTPESPALAPGPIRPGRYAVSSFMEHVGPHYLRDYDPAAAAQLERLLAELHSRGKRVAKVGSSITIWEL